MAGPGSESPGPPGRQPQSIKHRERAERERHELAAAARRRAEEERARRLDSDSDAAPAAARPGGGAGARGGGVVVTVAHRGRLSLWQLQVPVTAVCRCHPDSAWQPRGRDRRGAAGSPPPGPAATLNMAGFCTGFHHW